MDEQGVMKKLHYVQQHLKAPKGQYNSFGDYRYRSCEDIQESLKPLLGEVGAVLLLSDEIVLVGDRYYIKAAAIFQDTESSGRVKNVAYAREADSRSKMDAAQITGSASSYARKYALNGLFCIDDAKDPDSMDNGSSQQSAVSRNRKAGRSRHTGKQFREQEQARWQQCYWCEAEPHKHHPVGDRQNRRQRRGCMLPV